MSGRDVSGRYACGLSLLPPRGRRRRCRPREERDLASFVAVGVPVIPVTASGFSVAASGFPVTASVWPVVADGVAPEAGRFLSWP